MTSVSAMTDTNNAPAHESRVSRKELRGGRSGRLRNEQALALEQAVVARRRGLAVGAGVEDLDVGELPDRALALDDRARQDRVEARGERALGAGRGRARRRAGEREAVGALGDGRGLVACGAALAVRDLDELRELELALVVGERRLRADVGERG